MLNIFDSRKKNSLWEKVGQRLSLYAENDLAYEIDEVKPELTIKLFLLS